MGGNCGFSAIYRSFIYTTFRSFRHNEFACLDRYLCFEVDSRSFLLYTNLRIRRVEVPRVENAREKTSRRYKAYEKMLS